MIDKRCSRQETGSCMCIVCECVFVFARVIVKCVKNHCVRERDWVCAHLCCFVFDDLDLDFATRGSLTASECARNLADVCNRKSISMWIVSFYRCRWLPCGHVACVCVSRELTTWPEAKRSNDIMPEMWETIYFWPRSASTIQEMAKTGVLGATRRSEWWRTCHKYTICILAAVTFHIEDRTVSFI